MKKIVLETIKTKGWKRGGHVYEGEVLKGHHAEIVPGASIALYGEMPSGTRYVKDEATGHMVPNKETIPYRLEFKLGDLVEYDSYNLVYLGKIVSIAEKTITIEDEHECGTKGRGKTVRLDIATFSRKNYDFDLEKIRERNSEMFMTI